MLLTFQRTNESGPVLIVDDDPAVRGLLALILRRAGFAVVPAAHGDQAITHARGNANLALAVVDLLMPDKDGLETIRELRRIRPGIRIVAVSGAGAELLKVAALLGADDALLKPIEPAELVASVSGLLEGPRRERPATVQSIEPARAARQAADGSS